MTIAAADRPVSLVNDDDVPWAREKRGEDLGPLDVVHRDDGHRLRRPGVDADRERRHHAAKRRRIDDRRVDVEAFAKLARPLIAQAGRRQDQHAVRRPPRPQLRKDQARLNRLPEPDVVCQQHARAEAADNRQRRLELMGEEIQTRVSKRSQRAGRCSVGDQRAAGPPPRAATDEPRASPGFNALDDVERRDDAPLHARVRVADAREGDELAAVVRADLHDTPP